MSEDIKPKRGRPRKIKNNESNDLHKTLHNTFQESSQEINEENIFKDLHDIINNNINEFEENDSIDNEDYIRRPDESFMDKLIGGEDEDNNISEEDDDITKAIKLSRMEYLYKNNSLHNSLQNETYDIDKNIIEESININQSVFDEDIEKQIQMAIELSNKELEEEYINYEVLIKLESEKIEKEKRIKSLECFCKKIKTLTFTKSDIEMKKYIENVLNDYFDLKIDYIIVENEFLYKNLYEIIDSYYKIPIQKNFKKTAISEMEDNIIRSIFRI